MQRSISITVFAFAFLLLAGKLTGQSFMLNYFTSTPSGSDVVVAWQVPDEQGITEIKLFRKIDTEPDFKLLESFSPNGTRNYQFLDYTIFKEIPKSINYRLMVYRNGMVFTYYTNILHNPTSVQRTWGSIKAMFR